jgi:cold shock protein
MARGTVKWFDQKKGYGFIQPQGGGRDVFVHISAVEKAGLTGLNEGQIVEYEEISNRGRTSVEKSQSPALMVNNQTRSADGARSPRWSEIGAMGCVVPVTRT